MRFRRAGGAAVVALVGVALAIVLLFSTTPPGRAAFGNFLASLRIARPAPVTVAVPGFSGPTASRRLQDAVAGMIADTSGVIVDESDQPVPDSATAARIAGFTVRLPRLRRDSATFIVVGAHAVTMTIDRSQLLRILGEAGQPGSSVPASVNGGRVTMRTPRGIRIQYGNCPRPLANTIQAQLQGPPPPSTDNGDCIILIESPVTSVQRPVGLDLQQLVDLGLELSGMSPDQTARFRQMFSWPASLSMAMPRFMRSYNTVAVGGKPAMLINTAGRRGPTYDLFWTSDGVVYSLAGYGSSADAVPLASSTN